MATNGIANLGGRVSTATSYRNVVAATPVQSAYAGLLDQNRSNYAALSNVYGSLDLQNAATIRSTLEGLAPRAETLKSSLGVASIDTMSRFYRDHIAQIDTRGGLGGTLALIGKLETASGIVLDTQFSAGAFVAKTDREVGFVGTNYRLRSTDNALTVVSEVGLGKAFDLSMLKVGPRVSMRASHIGFGKSIETGGGPALFVDRDSFDSLQGRAGLVLSGSGSFRPYAAANYVHDFQSTPGVFGANFVGGIGPNALFALAGQDKNWGEISAGLTLVGDRVDISVGADTTVERKDVSNQSYKGSIKIRF